MKITKTMEIRKPRSTIRILSDIEYLICNEFENEKDIIADIQQLSAQLNVVKKAVEEKNYEKAFKIMNPAFKYYT